MLTIDSITGTATLSVYRITASDDPGNAAFVESFKSHYELQQPPRKVETDWTVIHMGISTYETYSRAAGTAKRFDKLGDYVARLTLTAGNGFNYAQTGPPGHIIFARFHSRGDTLRPCTS